MKKTYILTAALAFLFTALSSFSTAYSFKKTIKADGVSASELYEELDLADHGLNRDALEYAVKGYDKLIEEGRVANQRYLSVIDFTQPSNQKRFYLIDILNKELVLQTYVMHGKNSGDDMAEKFSNKVNSWESSLGFYITKQTYNGKCGLSLRLAGLDAGFNTNAEKRGVVVHGSQFISEERAMTGSVLWSEGCPALPKADYAHVIKRIKGGSVFFIYYPSENYLSQSTVLN